MYTRTQATHGSKLEFWVGLATLIGLVALVASYIYGWSTAH
jgi:hypothetical protein